MAPKTRPSRKKSAIRYEDAAPNLTKALYSAEAKRRRAKLIAQINAGWSEESQRALSRLGEYLRRKYNGAG